MAMVLMYKKAFEMTNNIRYYKNLIICFNWFLGKNDVGISLYDPFSRGCCNGIEEYGINGDQGAESTLSFLISKIAAMETKTLYQSKSRPEKEYHPVANSLKIPAIRKSSA